MSGCGTKENTVGNPVGENKIAVYTVADPTGDWGFPSPFAHYSRGPGYIRMSFIFDTLVWKNEQEYVPALAESWDYLPGENAYLFKLRKNVTWQDGQKFAAHDVVFTFNYLKDHPYQIVDSSMVQKVEAADDYTFKIYLSKLYAPFMYAVAGTMPILPEHIWRDVQNPSQFIQKEALIVSGPYKLVDYNKEQGPYLYEAYNEYYQGKPKVKQIKFIKMNSEMAAAALRKKQINAVQVSPELVNQLEKEGYKVLAGSHDWVAKMLINHQKEPLSVKEFRQALAYAVDHRALLGTCQRGHGLEDSPGLVPPDNPGYSSNIEQYPHNPVKAGEILASLGYVKKDKYYEKNGKVLELKLLVSGNGVGVPGSPGIREGEMLKE
jgi:peptide/nickel transport system substrate-binding protein